MCVHQASLGGQDIHESRSGQCPRINMLHKIGRNEMSVENRVPSPSKLTALPCKSPRSNHHQVILVHSPSLPRGSPQTTAQLPPLLDATLPASNPNTTSSSRTYPENLPSYCTAPLLPGTLGVVYTMSSKLQHDTAPAERSAPDPLTSHY